MPHGIIFDQSSYFGEPFAQFCRIGGVDIQRTGLEAHSVLILGERYHQALRTIYRKIMAQRPGANKELALALTVKGMNDTLCTHAVVPSTIVFGELPPV